MTFRCFPRPRAFHSGALLALGLAWAGSAMFAQTTMVLDDFSTDRLATDYAQKNVSGFGSGGWIVSGGELQPDTTDAPVNGYAAWVWTGNALQNVGDSFSIDITVTNASGDHNGGLSVWTSNTTTFDRVLEPRLSFDTDYVFLGSDQNGANVWNDNLSAGVINGPATVKITLSDVSGGDSTLRIDLSDADGAIGPAEFYTVSGYTGAFYVGPSSWQAVGGNIAFDNLTYTTTSAVPEPSTYAAIIGAAALGLAWMRRRTRDRRAGLRAREVLS